MDTTQQSQAIKADLKALLDRLTVESASASTALATQVKELEEGAATLKNNIASADKDIEVFIEEGGKEIDALIAEVEAEE